MAFPGPGALGDFAGLLLLALLAILLGEPVRSLLARWSGWLAGVDPVERAVVDLYLGGALVYVLAAVPLGLYSPAAVVVVGALAWALRLWRGPSVRRSAAATLRSVASAARRVPYWLVLASFLGLLAVEVAAAAPVPTGNTYDSSLYALYGSLLLLHHTIPLTLAPVDPVAVAFPQGATVWFTLGQGVVGTTPLRSSLLVTPLFLALGGPAAFAVGRRWWGTPEAGAAVAVVFALLGPFPREMVSGSNDLVLAVPLVLLLAAFAAVWSERAPPTWADALVFGGLAGYAAALNPVGTEWLFVVVPVSALLAAPRLSGAPARWIARYAASAALALVFVLPVVAVLVLSHGSPGFVPAGAAVPPGVPFGATPAQFVGNTDPFLFRPSDTWLSPFPLLRAELAALLLLGAAVLVVGMYGRLAVPRPFGRLAVSGALVGIAGCGAFVAAHDGVPGLALLVDLSSADQLSVILFLVYTAVAAVPLIVLFEWLAPRASAPSGGRPTSPPRPGPSRGTAGPATALSLVLVLVVVLPGAGVTALSLPSQLGSVYDRYSNVTAADLALLQYEAANLPDGARLLIAPGSAAEFLPANDPEVVLLYPMVPNFFDVNASYTLLVRELTNATLDASGRAALAALDVNFVAVTGRSSALFLPFSAPPLEADPQLDLVFHQGDAWLFEGPVPPDPRDA